MRARNLLPLMMFQIVLFIIGAVVHYGTVSSSYIHPQAQMAETIMAGVLALGVFLTFSYRKGDYSYARIAQGFALIGTIVGLITALIGVGPNTPFDYGFHLVVIAALIGGLFATPRSRPQQQFNFR